MWEKNVNNGGRIEVKVKFKKNQCVVGPCNSKEWTVVGKEYERYNFSNFIKR